MPGEDSTNIGRASRWPELCINLAASKWLDGTVRLESNRSMIEAVVFDLGGVLPGDEIHQTDESAAGHARYSDDSWLTS
jgi:hypothetical protein